MSSGVNPLEGNRPDWHLDGDGFFSEESNAGPTSRPKHGSGTVSKEPLNGGRFVKKMSGDFLCSNLAIERSLIEENPFTRTEGLSARHRVARAVYITGGALGAIGQVGLAIGVSSFIFMTVHPAMFGGAKVCALVGALGGLIVGGYMGYKASLLIDKDNPKAAGFGLIFWGVVGGAICGATSGMAGGEFFFMNVVSTASFKITLAVSETLAFAFPAFPFSALAHVIAGEDFEGKTDLEHFCKKPLEVCFEAMVDSLAPPVHPDLEKYTQEWMVVALVRKFLTLPARVITNCGEALLLCMAGEPRPYELNGYVHLDPKKTGLITKLYDHTIEKLQDALTSYRETVSFSIALEGRVTDLNKQLKEDPNAYAETAFSELGKIAKKKRSERELLQPGQIDFFGNITTPKVEAPGFKNAAQAWANYRALCKTFKNASNLEKLSMDAKRLIEANYGQDVSVLEARTFQWMGAKARLDPKSS